MNSPSMLDAQLRQALALHQAGRLAEAEAGYLQVLALRPDLTEIQVNCALAQLGQGKHKEGEASLRRVLARLPDFAKAHLQLGNALSFQQRFKEAIVSYRRAVALKPDYAEAFNNLGNALLCLGELAQAGTAYGKAVAVKPDFAQAHNNLGHVALQEGRLEQARESYARAVTLTPGYAEAHSNLGHALHKLGRREEAEAAFRTAIRLAPDYADAHLNLSACLFDLGKFAPAQAHAAQVVRLNPGAPDGHTALGNALRQQGQLVEAEASYREALRLAPAHAEAHKLLAMVLDEAGRLDEGFAHFARHGELVFGPGAPAGPVKEEPPFKQRHDREQQVWLGAKAGGQAASFLIGDGSRISGPAVNPDNQVDAISNAWRMSQPQIVVIDDLLTPAALDKLRHYCLDSTVWRSLYHGGYIGAFPEHGFAPPLLAQIAEELRSVYPALIGDHPLLHFWAFKYDSDLAGIKTHADFAAVNVNFWITPDEANLDKDHGGLVVWDAAAPLDWDFAKYNASEGDIRAFLEGQKAKPLTVPYRANRAVIFDSDLFHETDVIHFKPGYENRRINVTLLYGRRQGARQRFEK